MVCYQKSSMATQELSSLTLIFSKVINNNSFLPPLLYLPVYSGNWGRICDKQTLH